jgi:S-adenosylmethionine decarboxylase
MDAYGVDEKVLSDEGLVEAFLDSCPDKIGMTKITVPQVYNYRGKKPEDWGVSGFVLIAESHISVHTFPERGYLNVDIFSCKDFDSDAAERDVQEAFGAEQVKTWLMERGTDYDSPRTLYGAMVNERVGLMASNKDVAEKKDD